MKKLIILLLLALPANAEIITYDLDKGGIETYDTPYSYPPVLVPHSWFNFGAIESSVTATHNKLAKTITIAGEVWGGPDGHEGIWTISGNWTGVWPDGTGNQFLGYYSGGSTGQSPVILSPMYETDLVKYGQSFYFGPKEDSTGSTILLSPTGGIEAWVQNSLGEVFDINVSSAVLIDSKDQKLEACNVHKQHLVDLNARWKELYIGWRDYARRLYAAARGR